MLHVQNTCTFNKIQATNKSTLASDKDFNKTAYSEGKRQWPITTTLRQSQKSINSGQFKRFIICLPFSGKHGIIFSTTWYTPLLSLTASTFNKSLFPQAYYRFLPRFSCQLRLLVVQDEVGGGGGRGEWGRIWHYHREKDKNFNRTFIS